MQTLHCRSSRSRTSSGKKREGEKLVHRSYCKAKDMPFYSRAKIVRAKLAKFMKKDKLDSLMDDKGKVTELYYVITKYSPLTRLDCTNISYESWGIISSEQADKEDAVNDLEKVHNKNKQMDSIFDIGLYGFLRPDGSEAVHAVVTEICHHETTFRAKLPMAIAFKDIGDKSGQYCMARCSSVDAVIRGPAGFSVSCRKLFSAAAAKAITQCFAPLPSMINTEREKQIAKSPASDKPDKQPLLKGEVAIKKKTSEDEDDDEDDDESEAEEAEEEEEEPEEENEAEDEPGEHPVARVARQDAGARDDAETEALKIAESVEIAEIADRHEEDRKEALQTIDAKSNGTLQGVMDPGKDEGDDDVAAKSTDTLKTLLATAAASDDLQKTLKIADVEAEEAEEEEEPENEAEDDVDEVYTTMKPQKSKKRRLQKQTSEADIDSLADPVKNGTVGEDFADASDPLAVALA